MSNGKPAAEWDIRADIVFSRNILISLANRWDRLATHYMARGMEQTATRAMEVADRARDLIAEIG